MSGAHNWLHALLADVRAGRVATVGPANPGGIGDPGIEGGRSPRAEPSLSPAETPLVTDALPRESGQSAQPGIAHTDHQSPSNGSRTYAQAVANVSPSEVEAAAPDLTHSLSGIQTMGPDPADSLADVNLGEHFYYGRIDFYGIQVAQDELTRGWHVSQTLVPPPAFPLYVDDLSGTEQPRKSESNVSNAPMRRIAQAALPQHIVSPADPLRLVEAREMMQLVACQPSRPRDKFDRHAPRADGVSWLAARDKLLQRTDNLARFGNACLTYITVIGVDYSIFDMMTLEEIVDSLPRLVTLTFGEITTASAVEIHVMREGRRTPRFGPLGENTLLVLDTSFPPGTLQDLCLRYTDLPTPRPAGWRIIHRSACNMDGPLGLALGTTLHDPPMLDRMSSIHTSRPWPFEELYERLSHCSQGCRLPCWLNRDQARLDFVNCTIEQLGILDTVLGFSDIGDRYCEITMSDPNPLSCSLYQYLQAHFGATPIINTSEFKISLWAASTGTIGDIMRWPSITRDGPRIGNGANLTLTLHLPSHDGDCLASPSNSSGHAVSDRLWVDTHWLMVDWLVQAMGSPDRLDLVYKPHSTRTLAPLLILLRDAFRLWWHSRQHEHDAREWRWKTFSRPSPVMSGGMSNSLSPEIRDQLCLWCSIAIIFKPGHLSTRCEVDCTNLIRRGAFPEAHLPTLVAVHTLEHGGD